jgi:hypothetical protein
VRLGRAPGLGDARVGLQAGLRAWLLQARRAFSFAAVSEWTTRTVRYWLVARDESSQENPLTTFVTVFFLCGNGSGNGIAGFPTAGRQNEIGITGLRKFDWEHVNSGQFKSETPTSYNHFNHLT